MTNTILPSTSSLLDFSHPSFPEELIIHVLSYLPIEQLPTIELVTKQWQRLAQDKIVWHKHLLRYFPEGHPAFRSPHPKLLFYSYHNNRDFPSKNGGYASSYISPSKKGTIQCFHAARNVLVYNLIQDDGAQNITLYDIFCEKQIGEPLIIQPLNINADSTVCRSGFVHELKTNGKLVFTNVFPRELQEKQTIQVYKIKTEGQVPLESLTTLEVPPMTLMHCTRMHATEAQLFVAFENAVTLLGKIFIWDLNTFNVLQTIEFDVSRRILTHLEFHNENLLISCGHRSIVWNFTEQSLCTIEQIEFFYAHLKNDNLVLCPERRWAPYSGNNFLQIDLRKLKKSILGKRIEISHDRDAQLFKFVSELPVDSHTYIQTSKQHFFDYKTITDARECEQYSDDGSTRVVSGSKLFSLADYEIKITYGTDLERYKSRKRKLS